MKYISIELSAINEIIANRALQSTDFEIGRVLSSILMGIWQTPLPLATIQTHYNSDGILFTTDQITQSSRYLVIDLSESKLFIGKRDHECLTIFQKLLRFSKKIWGTTNTLTTSERIIPGTSKAVLFPLPGYRQDPFRLVIEREPWKERMAKRGHPGQYLLVYKSGYDGGDPEREQAPLTNFKKAYAFITQDLKTLVDSHQRIPQVETKDFALAVAHLDKSQPDYLANNLYKTFDEWLPLLTDKQRDFVQDPFAGPRRIEGPAGSGKTLCLMLKAVKSLRSAKENSINHHIVFVTHSTATRISIADALDAIDSENQFHRKEKSQDSQSLKVCTLSELCATELKQHISESEFLDTDAMETKQIQLLYISESFKDAMRQDHPSLEKSLSSQLNDFVKTEDEWKIAEMIQHEISVIIKGRSLKSLDEYKKTPALKYGLPATSNGDKEFIFIIFQRYEEKLKETEQFDNDDVVLSTVGQLDTPIWRRRRTREGYDALIIDETHLFNINEIQLFHHFTKKDTSFPIIYSIDRAQALGDQGWTTDEVSVSVENTTDIQAASLNMKTIFRSSPDIVNLAFSILSSGATLFTNFDNPVANAVSGFTETEEKLAKTPTYHTILNSQSLSEKAYLVAEQVCQDLDCRKGDILIASLDPEVLTELISYSQEKNKPHLVINKRGDIKALNNARQAGQFVISHADYVGGLEFHAVVLVGIDEGRVPPIDRGKSSRSYLRYVSHNRLYVAVSRAKYRIEILGEKARGPSRILEPAFEQGLLVARE